MPLINGNIHIYLPLTCWFYMDGEVKENKEFLSFWPRQGKVLASSKILALCVLLVCRLQLGVLVWLQMGMFTARLAPVMSNLVTRFANYLSLSAEFSATN